MRKLVTLPAVAALILSASAGGAAGLPLRAPAHSRVIVSATLNSTLQFFDATTLGETQPPLISRGAGPIRMVVTKDGCGGGGCIEPRLFVANHGGATGSVGMFDLSGDLVTESPLSPFPARSGSVGIDASDVALPSGAHVRSVFVTNTTFALGGCGMPKGSVTAFARQELPTAYPGPSAETLVEQGTVELDGAIPYSVAIAGPHHRAFASTNCGNTLNEIGIGVGTSPASFSIAGSPVSAATEAGPDGVAYDPRTDLIYVANIGASSVSVFGGQGGSVRARVALPNAHPIRLALADSTAGHHWLLTSNGGNDSVTLIDRDRLAACSGDCISAFVTTIPTGVSGGAPESVAYDPGSNRIFVVNKTVGAPSLSVIQISEAEGSVTGQSISTIPLTALGQSTMPASIPAFIAFDVVVQTR